MSEDLWNEYPVWNPDGLPEPFTPGKVMAYADFSAWYIRTANKWPKGEVKP